MGEPPKPHEASRVWESRPRSRGAGSSVDRYPPGVGCSGGVCGSASPWLVQPRSGLRRLRHSARVVLTASVGERRLVPRYPNVNWFPRQGGAVEPLRASARIASSAKNALSGRPSGTRPVSGVARQRSKGACSAASCRAAPRRPVHRGAHPLWVYHRIVTRWRSAPRP